MFHAIEYAKKAKTSRKEEAKTLFLFPCRRRRRFFFLIADDDVDDDLDLDTNLVKK